MILSTIIFFVLIFPFFCDFNIIFYSNDKKVYVSLYLFKFIKIIGGYFEIAKWGIIFHYSNKKAYCILLKKMKQKPNIKILSELFINKITVIANVQSETIFPLLYLSFLNIIMSNIINKTYLNKTKLITNTTIKESNNSSLCLYLKSTFIINFFVLIKILIKHLIGKK